ncbi:MAG: hypothetical protein HOY75_08280 [Streptomyces sp.]|nr:hypothetical protein [Streptomyces sp.]
MQPTWLTIADKAELAADLNDLPHDRITGHDGTAQVFTAGLGELEQWARWFLPLGCHITQQPAGTGVVLWTLLAQLGENSPVPIQVSALSLDTEQIDEDLAHLVAPTA